MASSPDVALVVVHDGVRKEFQIPQTPKLSSRYEDRASFLDGVFAAFSVSSQDYDIQHYRSREKLNDETLQSLSVAAAASNDALVCNLVRKRRRPSVGEGEDRRPALDLVSVRCGLAS